uniref:Tudor domain-containing protein n=1 Tax=Scophthalmus maximus TaxID=52904 RepID=A0A8D3CFG0_SCOMX
MPLTFRSVVPYTLPGVLALIGWWWYISRKKERIITHGSPEGAPTDAGLRTSPAEGSNGLVEKGTVSPTNDTECSTHRPPEVISQRTDHKIISRIHVQDNEAAPSLKDPAFAPEAVVEERPEPEGEVSQDKIIVSAVTPARVKRVIPSEADSQETPPSAQDFHQQILTSTPTTADLTFTALTTAHESITSPVTTEDTQVHSSGQEQDLELLAAGLVSGVITAATQEVLGVTRCQITDSSTPLASNRRCTQQEPVATAPLHDHLPTSSSQNSCESREAAEKEQQGKTNGCSSAPVWEPVEISHTAHQTNTAQKGHWPTREAAPSVPLLDMKLKGNEVATLAEDSACSTCHSEDGISSEDLQNSTFDNQMDVIQITDLSAREAALSQSSSEMATETIKMLNVMGLRNIAHVPCEVETDQSGGSDVNSMDSVDSGCTMSTGESQSNHAASSSSELIIWEIEVPKHLVGRLIGKQGRFVSFVKQTSGAKIYISTLPYTQDVQICHIEGSQQQVDKALSMIGKKFKDLDLTNLYVPPLALPSLPMTSWLLLPSGVTVEVIVVNIVSAGHVFVQQHTHPTYHALRSLDQQMFLCYSQPGTPALPSPAEVGVICAAPAVEGAWWRAQVITFYKETNEVEIRYVDYGGYDRVKIDSLRQIRSDFVTLPFQGAEVLLDNINPLPGEDRFSPEATSLMEEMTRGVALLAQVSNYDNNTGLPLVHLWNMVGEEVISVNRTLTERGLGAWVEGF